MSSRYSSYSQIDAKYKISYMRPCIDGVSRGCNLCTAYCAYDEHPGFLTDKLIKQHKCVEKECSLLRPKNNVRRENIRIKKVPQSDGFIEDFLSSYEGIKVIESQKIAYNYWHVKYITIANYDIEKIQQEIKKKFNVDTNFELLPYSFENAAKLIFK